MDPISLTGTPVLVVGAGIMGAGIAQVAAQAGHAVRLYDSRDGAAVQARDRLATTLDGLVAKGRMTADAAAATLARITPLASLDDVGAADTDDVARLGAVGLVVEAIVEDLAVKRALFADLESRVAEACVLATNTSSISVTALARGLKRPERLVGMHFFNPVPLMKLVEVVSGLHTAPAVAQAIFDLGQAWGKVPVHARSTPGFIVNRIARPYYAETLALLLEQSAPPQVLDACLRAAGFRMGPCELMDLIGHDTNFAVTNSVYEANFFDKRFAPSLVQRELVDGGLLGRKTGRGFYRYPDGAPPLAALEFDALTVTGAVTVHGDSADADRIDQAATPALAKRGLSPPPRERFSGWTGLSVGAARLVLTDGRTADVVARAAGIADVAVFDRPLAATGALAYSLTGTASDAWRRQAPAWLAALGFAPLPVADTPGLVVARTIAMLINEAADAVLQGVCTPEGADQAMKLGVNYPAGPFEWLAGWGAPGVVALLDALDDHHRGERYRVSPWLRARA
jgi:3-hydroxybutyryl-CoA dehydrogenase